MKTSRSSSKAQHQARSGFSWVSWLLLAGFLIMITLWAGCRPVMRWWRSRQAGEFLAAAQIRAEKSEWSAAARSLGEAAQLAPDDPAVVRAIADFQILTHSHPSDVAQMLQRLASTGAAGTEDIAKLARAQIDLGSHEAARRTLDTLPEAARLTSSKAVEAEAYLLKMEQRDNEADARLRTALATGIADAQTALKLAILDLKQPQFDVRQRGRNSLWNMAQENGVNAEDAIRLLAADPSLTTAEAGRLCDFVDGSHQTSRDLHYAVLKTRLRLCPAERDAILDRETQAVAGMDGLQKLTFARWLSTLNEPRRMLKFLPSTSGITDLSPELILLKLEALAQANLWSDLSVMLNRDLEKVIGTVSFNLWQARVASAPGGGSSSVRQHLNLAFDATVRGQNTQAAVQVAETAEQLGILDLATTFYQSTATLASLPQLRIALLEKAYALHLKARDTNAMLRVAVEVAKLTPGNQANSFRADYLALLVGDSIELVAFRIASAQATADTEFSARLLLLKAMASHRLHAPVLEPTELKSLQNLAWPPGHRAVLAAMITTNGNEAAGFQIAEKISAALLLREELKFLALAR